MARRLITLLTLAAVTTVVATPASAGARDGIKGKIFDTTCYGPCIPDPEPRLFTAPATVVIDDRARGGRVKLAVDDGRFRKRMRPGRYKVSLRIDDVCWQSDTDRVRVRGGRFKRVTLHASNVCVQ